MPLSIETKDAMLRHAFAGRDLWIALLRADGSEETAKGYERQRIDFGADITTITDELTNLEEILFPGFEASAPITGFAIFDAQGVMQASDDLEEAEQPTRRRVIFFDPGDLRVGIRDAANE